MADPLLANVLADAFAHHEAATGDGPERSLVLCDEGHMPGSWVGAYLDWQRAGDVAAAMLDPAGTDPDGRPLFALPAGLAPPSRGAAAGTVHGPAAASSIDPAANLIGLVWGTARDVFPVQAECHNFLCREIRRMRPAIAHATIGDLQRLEQRELGVMLDLLDGERHRRALAQLSPGVHRNGGDT